MGNYRQKGSFLDIDKGIEIGLYKDATRLFRIIL